MNVVTLLLSSSGDVMAVYADAQEAIDKRDHYNANPVLDDGTPDPDAPYTTQGWSVS